MSKSPDGNKMSVPGRLELPNEHHVYLHGILCCSFLVQIMDQLEESQYFNGTLKNRAKMLMKVLSSVLDPQMAKLCRHLDDARGLNDLMEEYEEFIRECCKHYTHSFAPLTEILKSYREDPEGILKKLDFNIQIKGDLQTTT